jgi:hypothetical protein
MCAERAPLRAGPSSRALLRTATGDEFAQQTVLQVLLAWLLDLSLRACAKATKTWRGWVDEDELEHQVVVIAFERIRALAGITQAWPAKTLLDETWRHLRTSKDIARCANRWRYSSRSPTPPIAAPPSTWRSSWWMRCATAGLLVAQLFYATRILGERREAVAPVAGTQTDGRSVGPL